MLLTCQQQQLAQQAVSKSLNCSLTTEKADFKSAFFMTINICMYHENHITGFTLVDITKTGVTHNKPEVEYQRNQQRNWETVLQCLGLRTQPMEIAGPICTDMYIDEGTFGEMYYGPQKVWCFTFSIEQQGIWKEGDNPLSLLHKDFNEVPIIQGLDETARFMLPIFYTNGAIKNIFFRLGRLDLNTI